MIRRALGPVRDRTQESNTFSKLHPAERTNRVCSLGNINKLQPQIISPHREYLPVPRRGPGTYRPQTIEFPVIWHGFHFQSVKLKKTSLVRSRELEASLPAGSVFPTLLYLVASHSAGRKGSDGRRHQSPSQLSRGPECLGSHRNQRHWRRGRLGWWRGRGSWGCLLQRAKVHHRW